MRDIARELGVGKTTVRQTLLANGVTLRPSNRDRRDAEHMVYRNHTGTAPYGFYSHGGRLHEDTKEQRVIQAIVSLRTQGKSLTAIAKHLNDRNIRPRTGKSWDHSVIRSILNRQQELKSQTTGENHGNQSSN